MNFTELDIDGVTRLETINHTKCDNCYGIGRVHIDGQPDAYECPTCQGRGMIGRKVVFNDPNKSIGFELQDEGRTLKIFINRREQ